VNQLIATYEGKTRERGGDGQMDLVAEAEQLVQAGAEKGTVVRMLGGIAIAMRCPTARTPTFARQYSDLDAVVSQRDRNSVDVVAAEIGLEADRAFNAQRGNERRCYHRSDGLKLDVFVETFSMCHDVPFSADRLSLDDRTVPLAELVLTKAQIVELTDKDACDLFVVFQDHDLTTDDTGINYVRIGELCGRDWGLWRTVTGTLRQLEEAVAHINTSEQERALVIGRVERLLAEMDAAPKSRKWKMRSRVGDRVQWYVLPEEPNEAVDLRSL
jgi:hypothetical protein